MILGKKVQPTLAEGYRSIPLVDALWGTGAGGTALANQAEALVTTEAQCTAQLCAGLAVH